MCLFAGLIFGLFVFSLFAFWIVCLLLRFSDSNKREICKSVSTSYISFKVPANPNLSFVISDWFISSSPSWIFVAQSCAPEAPVPAAEPLGCARLRCGM